MTTRIPKSDFFDKILHLLGKRRAIKIPSGIYLKYGPYVSVRANKENFWRAFLRPKGQEPPEGYVYPDDFQE
jgi:hypothetical protein